MCFCCPCFCFVFVVVIILIQVNYLQIEGDVKALKVFNLFALFELLFAFFMIKCRTYDNMTMAQVVESMMTNVCRVL